ncbi:putative E3 ubiquitin-protein ligase XBAT31 [Tanacetum coccineum]
MQQGTSKSTNPAKKRFKEPIHNADVDLVEVCHPNNGNVGLLCYSPLAGGALSGKYLDSDSEAAKRGRRIPYAVAFKHKYGTCAALLNPSSAEPLVWPSPLKFISELNQDAKALLEQALMEVINRERERSILKGTGYSVSSPSNSDATDMYDNTSEVIHVLQYLFKCCLDLHFNTVAF